LSGQDSPTLTRFNLFFPEKREFFLEGQGIFNFGVVNIQTDDEPLARALDTNFTALRLRRDVLRRSSIGALFRKATTNLRFSPRPAARWLVRKYDYNFDSSYITTGTGRLETRNMNGNFRIEFNSGGVSGTTPHQPAPRARSEHLVQLDRSAAGNFHHEAVQHRVTTPLTPRVHLSALFQYTRAPTPSAPTHPLGGSISREASCSSFSRRDAIRSDPGIRSWKPAGSS
jgi:hypothetical protein